MVVIDKLEVDLEVKLDNLKSGFKQAELIARDTGKKLDKETLIKFEVDLAELKIAKDSARKLLREAKAGYEHGLIDKKQVIEAERAFTRLGSATTEANRRLQNYKNTGDATLSRLGRLFNSVTDEIKQSRDELVKMGKSTKFLQKFDDDIAKVNKKFKEGKIDIKEYKKQLQKLQSSAKNTGSSFSKMSNTIKTAIKGFVAYRAIMLIKDALIGASKAAIEFEDAFVGVRKTINGTEAQYKMIENGLVSMSKKIPVSVKELGGIAEAGGQLGVATEDILGFTKAVAEISVTTNLTSDEAATAFARISAVTGEPIANISYMASAVVGLGNNFATTEKEIMDFSQRIAGSASIVGVTTAEIFGMASAFSSVGIQAEAGGTVVNKAMATINDAVNDGGSTLNLLASTSGKTAEQFSKDWKDDAGLAFGDFVSGLGKQGTRANKTIKELFGSSSQTTRAFLAVAGAGDLMTRSIKLSSKEFRLNNALNAEAEKRFNSTASQIQISNNKWKAFGATTGKVMNKYLIPLYAGFTDFFTKDLPRGIDVSIALIGDFLTIDVPRFLKNGLTYFKNFGTNIGIIFDNIPGVVSNALDDMLDSIKIKLNKGSAMLNHLPGINIKPFILSNTDNKKILKQFIDLKKGFLNNENDKQVRSLKFVTDRILAEDKLEEEKQQNYKEKLKKDVLAELNQSKTLKGIREKRAKLQDLLENTPIGTKKYYELQKQIEEVDKTLSKYATNTIKSSKEVVDKKTKEINLEKLKQEAYGKTGKIVKETYKKASKIIDEVIKNSGENIKKLDDQIKTLKDGISSLDEQLKGLGKQKTNDLAQRYVDILEREKEIKIELSKISNGVINSDDLEKKIKLEKELKNITSEQVKIKDNSNKDELNKQITELQRQAGLDETDKILERIANRKADLEVQKAEKLKQVADLEKQKADETAIIDKFTKDKTNLDIRYEAFTKAMEKRITDNLVVETNKRLNQLEILRQKAIETAKAMRSAGIHTAGIGGDIQSSGNQSSIVNTFNISGANTEEVTKQVEKVINNSYKQAKKGNY